MKLWTITVGTVLCASGVASAGGLLLPGAGAVSTSRAGAAVASTDDGEALAINPAGLAKTKGTTITLSAAIFSYAMQFARSGTYDPIAQEALPYEGTPYPVAKNDVKPPLGIGSFQPVPVFTVTSDLGGVVPNLRVAAGVYAPAAYPFRDMCSELSSGCKKYAFNGDFDVPPLSTRYDIVKQEAAVVLPSIAASYRILPQLDVGARFSAGFANLKSTIAIWGMPDNFTEYVKQDALFNVDAKDSFVPAFGLGATYRPTPAIELAAAFSSAEDILAKGEATSEVGPAVSLNGAVIQIGPTSDDASRCATGGTFEKQKVCVELALPATATLGGRYKFFGKDGAERGDVELDLGWERWTAGHASDYRVVVDADIYVNGASALGLRDNIVRHAFKDTFNARLGGSYKIPMAANTVILRGGVGYDTQAAKTGWLRADIDGAARTTVTVGAGFRAKHFEVNLGGGAILEGSPTNAGECNPIATKGCNGDGVEKPADLREGPDPINPLVNPSQQAEAPTNKGTFKSHYVLLMLGVTTWF